MSTGNKRRGTADHAIVALLDGQPGAFKAELGRLDEVPLPGRPAVTLAQGSDPGGVVPGYTEALTRQARLLGTVVHCPREPVTYALEEVLIRRGEVELHLVLFDTRDPASENQAMARLTLRFQTATSHVEGRTEALTVRRHAASRAQRLAQARQRAGSAAPARRREPAGPEPVAAADAYSLDIDDDDDDLPPPFDPQRLFDGQGPPRAGGLRSNARLIGLFGLFLATVFTWQVFSSNRDAIAHERFNQRLAERQAQFAQADAPTTTVRLDAPPELVGDLDLDVVEEALYPAIDAVGDCYRELEGWATLPPEGTVSFTLSLPPGRVVSGVEVGPSSLDSERVITCAAQALETLSGLPPGAGDATVSVRLRFTG